MNIHRGHECGVLLTQKVVGTTLYSHGAACRGRLVKLFVMSVGWTHTRYKLEGNDEEGFFCTGNQGQGAKNWEAVDLQIASDEIRHYWRTRAQEKAKELETLHAQWAEVERQLTASADSTKTH